MYQTPATEAWMLQSSAGPHYVPALGLVLGLLSLALLAVFILFLLRERASRHVRARAREQITRDLALLDASIHAEMKRYESLSRLERGA